MNGFQIVTLTVLALALGWHVVSRRRASKNRTVWLLQAAVLLAAAYFVADPDATFVVAGWLGIGRGADLVLYAFALGLIGVSFYFYSRYVSLQRQVTEIVRRMAVEGARRGGATTEEP
jgi:hypothetical protein